MYKYKFLALAIFLGIFLIGPFLLKLKDPRLEIYPAVIFPSGAYIVKNDDDVLTVHNYSLYGLKDSIVKLDHKLFFGDIPVWYLRTIADGNFGLKKYNEEFKIYKPPLTLRIQNYITPESVSETKDWIRLQLRKQNLNDSILILRKYSKNYDLNLRAIVNQQLIDEEIYKLSE